MLVLGSHRPHSQQQSLLLKRLPQHVWLLKLALTRAFSACVLQTKGSASTMKRRAGRGMAQGINESAQHQNSSSQPQLAAAAIKPQQAADCSCGFITACRLAAAQDELCSKGLPVHVSVLSVVLSAATVRLA